MNNAENNVRVEMTGNSIKVRFGDDDDDGDGSENSLFNVLTVLLDEGRMDDIYQLLGMCVNNGFDPYDPLNRAFSTNWARGHRTDAAAMRIHTELIPFVNWLHENGIRLPSATVMMLCDPQSPEFDDLEMANFITLLAVNPMAYSYCWESTIGKLLLERGSIHTAIALSRCLDKWCFIGSATCHLWYVILQTDQRDAWADVAVQSGVPVMHVYFDPDYHHYEHVQVTYNRLALMGLAVH